MDTLANLKAFITLPENLGGISVYFDQLTLHPDGTITTDAAMTRPKRGARMPKSSMPPPRPGSFEKADMVSSALLPNSFSVRLASTDSDSSSSLSWRRRSAIEADTMIWTYQ